MRDWIEAQRLVVPGWLYEVHSPSEALVRTLARRVVALVDAYEELQAKVAAGDGGRSEG